MGSIQDLLEQDIILMNQAKMERLEGYEKVRTEHSWNSFDYSLLIGLFFITWIINWIINWIIIY